MTSRREFLQASSLALALSTAVRARQLKTVGVQLYTVRTVLPEKTAETLRAIEQIGFREVEPTYATLDKIWPAVQQTRMKPVSIHLDTQLFMKNADKLPAALESAAKHGFEYVVCPYIAPQDRGGPDVMKKLAAGQVFVAAA